MFVKSHLSFLMKVAVSVTPMMKAKHTIPATKKAFFHECLPDGFPEFEVMPNELKKNLYEIISRFVLKDLCYSLSCRAIFDEISKYSSCGRTILGL